MLRFFRKIRQSLLSDGKTGKYLKYAVGEIILVVIGILIALQINNWNQNVQERKLEKELLIQLQSEFKSNLEQLEAKIVTRDRMVQYSIKLLEYLDNKTISSRDSIYEYLSYTYLAPTFDPIVNDLTSSGRIQLIRSSELKELLSRWTSQVVQVTEVEKSWLSYRNQFYFPVLHANSSMRNLVNYSWTKNSNKLLESEEQNRNQLTIGYSRNAENFTRLFESPNFEDNLSWCAYYGKAINKESEILKSRIIKLQELIQKEIDLL